MREPASQGPDDRETPLDETWIPEQTRPPEAREPSPQGSEGGPTALLARPVLASVAIYAETAEEAIDPSDPLRSEHGRCFALRAGDVLFVGKPPGAKKLKRPDGSNIDVTHMHLFPRIRAYQYVSKKHLALEVLEDGTVSLLDYSANGSFLVKASRHVRRVAADEVVTGHKLAGPETVVLGIDLSLQRDTRMMDYANRHRLQIVPMRPGSSS